LDEIIEHGTESNDQGFLGFAVKNCQVLEDGCAVFNDEVHHGSHMKHLKHIEASHVNPILMGLHIESEAMEHEEEGYPNKDLDDTTGELDALEVTTLLLACLYARPRFNNHGHEHHGYHEG